MLVGDCASDPPLGATLRALAARRADDVVYGLGAVALARGHRAMALAARDDDARAALAAAIARVGGRVELLSAADAWPAVAAGARDELLPADVLVTVADEARGRARVGYVTVAGAVKAPCVTACAPAATMAELVALAGGGDDDDWVALAGGAPAGKLVAREATFDEAGSPSLVVVLPAGHALVRRLRTSVGDWLWRAASACEGCRACSDGCPSALAPHALVATLATGRDDGVAPAEFVGCTGCGVCDVVCPAALSPRALAVAVRDRLGARLSSAAAGAVVAPRAAGVGLDRALMALRLDLARYARAPEVRL